MQGLREASRRERLGARILFPTPGLSTDNAAMIAAAAFRKFEAGQFAGWDLAAKANLPLDAQRGYGCPRKVVKAR